MDSNGGLLGYGNFDAISSVMEGCEDLHMIW